MWMPGYEDRHNVDQCLPPVCCLEISMLLLYCPNLNFIFSDWRPPIINRKKPIQKLNLSSFSKYQHLMVL